MEKVVSHIHPAFVYLFLFVLLYSLTVDGNASHIYWIISVTCAVSCFSNVSICMVCCQFELQQLKGISSED